VVQKMKERNALESLEIHSYIVFVDNEYDVWVKILTETEILKFFGLVGLLNTKNF